MPKKNFSIGLDETEADILENEVMRQGINYSKYIAELLIIDKKTPRQRILSLLDHLQKNLIIDAESKRILNDAIVSIQYNLAKI